MFTLTNELDKAQDEIVDLVQKNKSDFDQKVSCLQIQKSRMRLLTWFGSMSKILYINYDLQ